MQLGHLGIWQFLGVLELVLEFGDVLLAEVDLAGCLAKCLGVGVFAHGSELGIRGHLEPNVAARLLKSLTGWFLLLGLQIDGAHVVQQHGVVLLAHPVDVELDLGYVIAAVHQHHLGVVGRREVTLDQLA